MKKRVDVAETLVEAADRLPDLVFNEDGDLVSGEPSKPVRKRPKAPSSTPTSRKTGTVRRPR